jgi:hypothetical protein
MRIVLRLYSKGKAKKYFGTSIRRMLYKINNVKFDKAYVKVTYGRFLAVNNKMTEFFNDGYYFDPKEAAKSLTVFWYES